MKSFNWVTYLLFFCLMTISSSVFSQQAYKKMIVGKWQPILSTREIYDFNGNRDVKTDSQFSNNDIIQFNADGSINDGGQRYYSYSLEEDSKILYLFDEAGYEKRFEINQLDKTTMKITLQVTESHRGHTSRGIWTVVFKRK